MHSEKELSDAALDGNLTTVKRLIEEGAAIDAVGDTWNPLHAAIENEQVEVVELLLRSGANVEVSNCGMTPLEHAVDISVDGTIQSGGKPGEEPIEIIQLLLDYGASRHSALELAKKYRSKRVVAVLSDKSE